MSTLPESLRAVGAVLGLPITVTEDDTWHLDQHGLRVGLGWYASRGHPRTEAVALAALHLWEGPRSVAHEPERAARRHTLTAARPEATTLIDSVVRLQARSEVLTAMPGLRDPLDAAMRRILPDSPETLPRHLQWVVMLWFSTLDRVETLDRAETALPLDRDAARGPDAASSRDSALHPDVAREWRDTMRVGDTRMDPLRRVLARDPSVSALRSFERALALLLPPYERLRERDLAERGITSIGLGVADHDAEVAVDLATTAAEGSTLPQEETGDAAEAEQADDANWSEDLFALERAELAQTMLETPIPSDAPIAGDTGEQQLSQQTVPDTYPVSTENREAERAAVASATAIAEYRERSAHLAPAIERMREVWARVITERAAARRTLSRTPRVEGDSLAPEAFAQVVADTLAGVRQPAALHARESQPRTHRDVGSTDYVLMVDRSASMTGPAAAAAADALIVLAEGLSAVMRDIAHAERTQGVDLELDLRSCLVVFGADAHVVKPLSHSVDDETRRRVHAAVLEAHGSTNDAAALRAAGEQLGVGSHAGHRTRIGHRPLTGHSSAQNATTRRRIAILVSDGGSNDPAAADRELRRLREGGIEVYGVGIGTDDLVQRYAPHGTRVDDARRLGDALTVILDARIPGAGQGQRGAHRANLG